MAMDKSLHLHLLLQYKIRANSSEAQLTSVSCSDSAWGVFFLIKAALAIARQLLWKIYRVGAQICRIKWHTGNMQSAPFPQSSTQLQQDTCSSCPRYPQYTYCIGTTTATED